MGKSPGKWIKGLLFGKKSSKSNLSKGREISKHASKGDALVCAKVPASDLTVDAPLTSLPVPLTTARNGVVSDSEKGTASRLPNDGVILSSSKENGDTETIMNLGLSKDPERIRHEQAATKAQAAFRGYLARRAFRTLKGIIRLQALGRGRLVRRQAIATLCCVQGIVKFQALVRGQSVRHSNIGTEVHEKLKKLSKNVFVCTLLASSPTSMPLHLQYGPGEPNSAWDWLERWTKSHFWEPLTKPKKIIDSKSQKKRGTSQTVETDRSRPKRSVRKATSAKFENGSTQSTLESDKPKRNLRKVSSHPVDSKTKSKLRKNLKSTSDASDQLEVKAEKPKHSLRKSSSAASDAPEQGTGDSLKKIKKDMAVTVSKQSDIETSLKPPAENELVDNVHDHTLADLQCVENNGKSENIPEANKDMSYKDNDISNDDQKTSQRRASLPGKHDYQENGLHNTPRLPSYMAATESAKAKLRALGSPRFGQDEADKNGITRRHSLPSSSTNGKLSSWSPRAQRLVQASGKGVFRSDRSLMSSRDGSEKLLQPEWRR
ncbi:hypothetical protein AAG906_019208 [Vitis piasezkii]